MPGMPLTACLVCSWIRPAIAREPPDGISSVVSARRVLTEGTEIPLMLIELSLDTSDTSVITRRLILPSVSTTGVKLSEMPNFLKAIDGEHCPTAPDGFVWHVTPVGKGNSPPTMNVADSPEMAVRLGSASVRTTPALSIARRLAVTVGTPALFKADAVSELAVIGPLLAVNGLL